MRAFEECPECQKCGSELIRFKYISIPVLNEPGLDRLLLKCLRCGYDWEMKTKDNKTP